MKLLLLTFFILLGLAAAQRVVVSSSASASASASASVSSRCPRRRFRTFDGTCNANGDLGAANRAQLRLRGRGSAGGNRPGARLISNAVMDQVADVRNDRRMSELVTFFGQFIDHTIVETPMNRANPFPIPVPANDPAVDAPISFSRSVLVRRRDPLNTLTSFIDASSVYGVEEERVRALRAFRDGKLKTGRRNLLPDNEEGLENAPSTSPEFFIAGDIRANENPMLTSLHTLFVREHNVIAEEIEAEFPRLNDEQIFLLARKINSAQLQKIVYEEWLPALLGPNAIPPFQGFDPNVRPVTSVFFSTAAFRVGHTLLNNEVTRLGRGRRRARRRLLLKDVFMDPELVRDNGIEPFIRGIANTQAQEVDTQIVDGLRNFLFSGLFARFPNVEGFDLAAANIQRGRDHRIPSYNQARRSFGLPTRRRISEVSSDRRVVRNLARVYRSVNDIDAWVGALAEDRVAPGSLGELLRAAWIDEFTRLRDGDRFFYLADPAFTRDLRRRLPRVARLFNSSASTMRAIILETTSIRSNELPRSPFFA